MQLPSGEVINGVVPAGLSDDDIKSYVRMKRPDLFGAPAGVPGAKTEMKYNYLGTIPGDDPNFRNPWGAYPGASAVNRPVTGKDLVPGAAVAAPAAAYMGGATALPFLVGAARAHPWIAQAVASAAISEARNIPAVGKFIPPYSEWLPFLIGGKGAEAKPGTPAPPVKWGPKPEVEPTPSAAPPPIKWGQQPEAEPSTLPFLRKPSTSNAELGRKLDQPLRDAVGAPPAPKAGIPIGMTPVESSAMKAYRYDPSKQEMHVMTNDGTTYVHAEVTPDQAQAFQAAPSKGQAWQAIRDNSTLVGKIPPRGNRIDVKPPTIYQSASPTDQPPSNDLTDILSQSVQKAKAAKARK